jgi:ABC-type nitrate/sulfonate/bicarbonate transport system permease component
MDNWIDYVVRNYDVGIILTDCVYSFTRVLVGVSAAIVIGVILGLFRSSWPIQVKRNKFVNFCLDAPKFIAPIAWIPFIIFFAGIGEMAAYCVVFIAAFAPISTSSYEGAESVPINIRNVAMSMEISGCRYLVFIIFPSSLPHIFTGIRNGVIIGWMSIVAAEMISGQSGLGYAVKLNDLNLQYDLVAFNMLLIGLIGFILFQATIHLEKKMISWNEKTLL